MTLVPFKRSRTPVAYTTGFEDFDRMFDSFFKNALTNVATPAASVGNVALKMNVSETEKAYIVEAELPGIEEKDVDLTVKEGILTVSGEKAHEQESEGKTFHRIERSYGNFTRSLQLPADADEDKIDAHMKNGVLEITISKRKEAVKEPKRISIKKS